MMAELENEEVWIENIGEIKISEDGEFVWKLPEISFGVCEFECVCVSSPCFSFDGESWRFVIKPFNPQSGFEQFQAVSSKIVFLKSCSMLKRKYSVQLSLKANNTSKFCRNSEIVARASDFLFLGGRHLKCVCLGFFKIHCEIQKKYENHREETHRDVFLYSASEIEEFEKEIVTIGNKRNSKTGSEPRGVDRLIQNFGKLLDSAWCSDVILKTNDNEFRVHRIILSARSPVFSAMFRHNMTENNTGEVDVSDCSASGLKIFLQYLYTGVADTMSPANVVDVYYIADKYQVDDLKRDCIQYMKMSLSMDNFCDVIALSVRHSESDLQNSAIQFFCMNIKRIIKTAEWQKYITQYPIQANELFIKAINA